MDLMEAVRGRRSIRAFRKGTVPPEAIATMKEAIRWAPSAGDLQARRFWFVTDAKLKAALGQASYQAEIFRQAPLVVVGCADLKRIEGEYGERGRTLYVIQDVAASVQNLLLAVHAAGLGAVWIGAFRPEAVSEALDLPAHHVPQVLVPIGAPDEKPKPTARRRANHAFAFVD